MNASFRIALTYFSFVALQKWLNWIFGATMVIALVLEMRAETSHALGGWMILATLSAMLVAMAPALGGGFIMRIGSSPTVLHLRPAGRRHMLAGATLAVTLAAILVSLPMAVAQLADAQIPGKATDLANPGFGTFQALWGGASLTWILVFALSRYQILAAFSFVLVVTIANMVIWSAARLPITTDQFVTIVFLKGLAAWIIFAVWYLRTPSVTRPGWQSGRPIGKPAAEPDQLTVLRGFPWKIPANAPASRKAALSHYLTGSDDVRGQLVFSAVIVLLLLADVLFSSVPPRAAEMSALFIIGVIVTIPIVRRSRLLWLRTGLDRHGLFRTAERFTWRSVLSLCGLPMVFFVALYLTQGSEQFLRVLLFLPLQLAFTGCLLYAGLATTRGWGALLIVMVFPAALFWIFMDPETNFSLRTYPMAFAVVGAIAIAMRAYARRRWLQLDWRLSGPPLASQGWRGN